MTDEGNNGDSAAAGHVSVLQGAGPSQLQIPGAAGPIGMHPGSTSYARHHFAQNFALQEQLRKFWQEMLEDVKQVGTDPAEFKSQQLPLARIKKIMKSDEDVRMISAEAPVLFAKACEFFILEMTLRAWNAAEEHKRRTLQRSDIATAITRTEVWDFLLDTVPLEGDASGAGGAEPGPAPVQAPGAGVPLQPTSHLPPGMPPMYPGQAFLPGMGAPGGPGLPHGAMGMAMSQGGMMYPGMFLQQPPSMAYPPGAMMNVGPMPGMQPMVPTQIREQSALEQSGTKPPEGNE